MILDEATSSLDNAMENRILDAVGRKFHSATQLTITHRVHKTVDVCDKILVMDAGRVVEFDTPQRLMMDRTSVFSSMLLEGQQVHS